MPTRYRCRVAALTLNMVRRLWPLVVAVALVPSTGHAVCSQSQKPTNCAQCAAPFCDGDVWTCDGAQPAGTPCNDGNLCTTGDECDGAGSCVPSGSVSCNPPPPCHLAVSCNTSTGTCPATYSNAPDGTSCTAGVPANATGQCTAGSCGWTCNGTLLNCNGACAQCCSNADCPIGHGTLTCTSGACGGLLHCADGFKACGAACIPSSQCCTNADCPVTNGSGSCSNGTCVATCTAGYTQCSSTLCVNVSNGGCCSNTDCGVIAGHQSYCVQNQCSVTCSVNSDCSLPGSVGEQTCSSGLCSNPVICAAGYKACATSNTCVAQGGCCADPDCASGLSCIGGACSLNCAAGTQPCGSICVSTSASVCCPQDNW